jgi:hypothetical protein
MSPAQRDVDIAVGELGFPDGSAGSSPEIFPQPVDEGHGLLSPAR